VISPRPFRWEAAYPPGLAWDHPIITSTLPALLDSAAGSHADRPALGYGDRSISYRELAALSAQAAAAFLQLGLSRGDAVALYLPNTPWHPIALFGAARAGLRAVQLSPLDAERELAYKLEDSGARCLVTTNRGGLVAMAQKLKAGGHVDHIIVGDDADWGVPAAPVAADCLSFMPLIAASQAPGQRPAIDEDDVVLLQYTGGTTGTPKGAMLTHANLTAAVASYEAWARGHGMSQPGTERVICVLPLFHIYALSAVMLRHLANGNEVLLRQRFDVETTLNDIEVRRATAFPGVPTMWIALAAHPGIERRDFSSLRSASSGGAPLPVEVAQRVERATGLVLRDGYGMTETAPAATSMPRPVAGKEGSIGLPMPGIAIAVVALDDPMRLLPPGEIGELRIHGRNVMKGYWRKPQETAAALVDGGFLTGDIGYMDADGYFFLVDRKKDMIISGGYNVYPRMIEDAIFQHPDVEEVIVVGIPDAYRGEAAKAFVKLRAGATALTLEALRDFLADRLGRHELPAALEIRSALPRTAVGKLSRKELAAEERAKAQAAMEEVKV
jgi:long-chain acyl-CoA synthetase